MEIEKVKCFGFSDHGGLEALSVLDLPEPHPGPGEVRVAVKVAGLNHLDLFTLEGIPGLKVNLPHVLAGDGTGIVDEIGKGVTGARNGDIVMIDPSLADGTCEWCRCGLENFCKSYRILGEHINGTAAEFVIVPQQNVVPLPERLGWEGGAAVALVFMTAWHALVSVGELKRDDRVAIVGAGGGLATAAIQVAHHLGARTFVVTRSREKGERALKLGADEMLVPTAEHPMAKGLWEASGKRGFDIIFDSAGRSTFAESTRALGRGGRLVFCGGTTGPVVEVDLRNLFWRGASLRGSTMATRSEFRTVLKLLAEGKLHPVIDSVFPIDDGRTAVERLSKGDIFGKVLIRVR